MTILFSVMLIFIALTPAVIFAMLVYPGVERLPMWFIYASYPITAMGGGVGIHLILNGLPK